MQLKGTDMVYWTTLQEPDSEPEVPALKPMKSQLKTRKTSFGNKLQAEDWAGWVIRGEAVTELWTRPVLRGPWCV